MISVESATLLTFFIYIGLMFIFIKWIIDATKISKIIPLLLFFMLLLYGLQIKFSFLTALNLSRRTAQIGFQSIQERLFDSPENMLSRVQQGNLISPPNWSKFDSQEVIPILMKAVQSYQSRDRAYLLQVLQGYDDPRVHKFVPTLMSDSDSRVRISSRLFCKKKLTMICVDELLRIYSSPQTYLEEKREILKTFIESSEFPESQARNLLSLYKNMPETFYATGDLIIGHCSNDSQSSKCVFFTDLFKEALGSKDTKVFTYFALPFTIRELGMSERLGTQEILDFLDLYMSREDKPYNIKKSPPRIFEGTCGTHSPALDGTVHEKLIGESFSQLGRHVIPDLLKRVSSSSDLLGGGRIAAFALLARPLHDDIDDALIDLFKVRSSDQSRDVILSALERDECKHPRLLKGIIGFKPDYYIHRSRLANLKLKCTKVL